jgi:integrase
MAGRRRGNGEGSISRRRDGRWVARYHVETPEGKKRKALYANSRPEAASKLVAAIAQRDGRPLTAEPSKLPLSEYFHEWLDTKKPELAPDTYRRYQSIVETHLPLLGSIKLPELRRAHIETLKSRLQGTLEPSTTTHVMAVLSSALNQAVAWELIESNPTTHVARPKARRKKMRSLSEGEAARLVESVRGTRTEAMYLVALKLGPRAGELRGLRWRDIDMGRGTMTIEWSVSTQYEVIWGPTKSGEARTVRLSPGLLQTLSEHRARQQAERVDAKVWEDPSLVFPNQRGGVFRHQGMHKFFKRDLDAAGLPREIRFHDMRHTCATLLLRSGTPVHVVSKILGHADPAMTLRLYSHALPDMDEAAALAMDKWAF